MEIQSSDIKSYNITEESIFIEISNVPSLNLLQELADYIRSHSTLSDLKSKHIDSKLCIQSFLAQFPNIYEARKCKKAIHKQPFFGQCLNLTYRPELESWHQTLSKLQSKLSHQIPPKRLISPSDIIPEIRAKISLPEEAPSKRRRI